VIARLVGTLVDHQDLRAVIDVAGVGWEVWAPRRVLAGWMGEAAITAWISTQVREESIQLYGFATDVERRCFDALLAVSGVGPKTALACLDVLAPDALVRAIEAEDVAGLTRVPGVGRKTAQKMVIDLKGKLPMGFAPVGPARATPRAAVDPLALALAQLDYGRGEIDRAQSALVSEGIGPDAPLPQRLRAALRVLSSLRASP
jgi:Holliday junction DNA helicase RuvA